MILNAKIQKMTAQIVVVHRHLSYVALAWRQDLGDSLVQNI